MKPANPRITGIGSLPHHNVDAALEYAFRFDIAYLPQIPIRNPNEFMIAQALEKLPGLVPQDDGTCLVDVEQWQKGKNSLEKELAYAFKTQDYKYFVPTLDYCACWKGFLWEVSEQKRAFAKVQLTGPITAQLATQLTDGQPVDSTPELSTQIVKLIHARASAMVEQLKKQGTQTLLFLDEPGLYAFSSKNPKHSLALQDLKLLVTSLRKQGAFVGLHCCSNTDWRAILELGLNLLSFDVKLSLDMVLPHATQFLEAGNRFALGVIPTNLGQNQYDLNILYDELKTKLHSHLSSSLAEQTLEHCFLTPACGLALKSTAEAEAILSELKQFQRLCQGEF